MTKPSILIGILIVSFIVISGLAVYFLIIPLKRMREKQKLMEAELISEEKKLLSLNEKIDKKRTLLAELSKKIGKAGKKLGRVNEVKNLRKDLREKNKKNHELEMEIKRLNHNIEVRKRNQSVEKSMVMMSEADNNDGTEKIKQKYPALPKNQLERIEIERSIARALMKNNGGSFHISQILRTIEGLYPKHIKPNDRLMLLNEIKSWIERDPLCKGIKTTDKIQHYTFI